MWKGFQKNFTTHVIYLQPYRNLPQTEMWEIIETHFYNLLNKSVENLLKCGICCPLQNTIGRKIGKGK